MKNVSKRKHIKGLAGQRKFSNLKDAFQTITDQMGDLHVQTTERVKTERRRR